MRNLSKTTKLKLIIPIIYAVAALLFFVLAWPNEPKVYHWVGVVVTLLSFIAWIIARIQLGNAFSIAPKSKYLVKSGIYSKLRHPVYYFSITAVAGLSLFAWHFVMIPVLVVLVILELFRIKKEEMLLSQSFDKEYASYKKQTWF